MTRDILKKTNRKTSELIIFQLFVLLVIFSCYPAISPYLSIDQIIIDKDLIYLIATNEESWDHTCNDPACFHYLVSTNYGNEWLSVSDNDFGLEDEIELEKNLTVVECVPGNSQVCYRIDGNEYVEISMNGGSSWDIDWKIPIGRKKYMQGRGPFRLSGILPAYPLDSVSVNTPRDLKIISNNGSYKVFVAMGIQGLLIKEANEVWNRRGVIINSDIVRSALPSPYRAYNFPDLFDNVMFEIILSIILSAILAMILYNKGKGEFKKVFNKQTVDLIEELDRLLQITFGSSIVVLCSSWILISLWGFGIIPIYEISLALILLVTVIVINKWSKKKNKLIEKFEGIGTGDILEDT